MVLMFDGPSLGGFVCPATVTSSQLWKMGQVTANDTIRFKRVTLGVPPPPLQLIPELLHTGACEPTNAM